MRIGWQEILIIVLIILLLFGAKRIPELMRSMGKGIKSFREGIRDEDPPADSRQEEKKEEKKEEK